MNKKDKLLIKWIKNQQLESPNVDFTEDFLEILQENETSLKTENTIVNKTLDHSTLDPINKDFTKRIVSLIEKNEENQVIEPLISKKVLGAIISSSILLSLFFEIYNNSEQIEVSSVSLDIIYIMSKFMQKTPIILIYSMASAVLILTIEKILQTLNNELSKN
ncbi:hypothetical protein [uncultured Aquimarina sp.]|uniref:hypothetical protein n=1 Tax=uncultured Aquimarina sp. TaxID=575652 RepID=UPI00260E7634|nr:hypothetical protein [uncultured Aquimarina sp.]